MAKQWMGILLIFSLVISLQAQNPVLFEDTQSTSLRYAMVGLQQAESENSVVSKESAMVPLKKPGRAALFSAILPGTGEMYGGSWLKGALFLGAEISLWAGYLVFYNEGVDWRNQFHDFADQYWSEARYWLSVARDAYASSPTDYAVLEDVIYGDADYLDYIDLIREYEHENHHHTLPEERIQQYFEVIGKYDFFAVGWEDYDVNKPELTPLRNKYENMRNSSNVEFKRASTCAMVVMANHLISPLDAAWTISKQNREIRAAMHVDLKPIRDELMPFYGFNIEW
ncbi:hypothetical protein HQ585_20775 [candidate division KSB1 bacterium]|nr:hypothetical protein [candidate division KSB1 bacterium]